MRIELVIVERIVIKRAGGHVGVVEHYDLERVDVGWVGRQDGDLLLQPEPVRGRLAEGRAG
jgi:hypothetical protein